MEQREIIFPECKKLKMRIEDQWFLRNKKYSSFNLKYLRMLPRIINNLFLIIKVEIVHSTFTLWDSPERGGHEKNYTNDWNEEDSSTLFSNRTSQSVATFS